MQEQNSSKLRSESLLKRGCKQNSVNARQHLSVSQVALALSGVITRHVGGFFLAFIFHILRLLTF